MHKDAIHERDELDAVLDDALATYVDAGAKPGLAQCVFEVTSRRERRRSAIRRWAVAVPALAAAVLTAIFVAHRAGSPSERSPLISSVPSSTSSPALPVQPARRAHSAERHAVKPVTNRPAPPALPRREVFPTPAPLTAEEQAVLKLGNQRLEEVSAQTIQSTTQDLVQPIHIAAIEIPPLNPPDNSSN
ncbi:MAG: hypothetical protein JO300_04915 [Silvibacterium sp.]|nr:hypothetical protein [Silvibacterium sp.]MBV8437544.1 hypothetical protein [Silvibacterium sp.]